MDDDGFEPVILFISAVIALGFWSRWCYRALSVAAIAQSRHSRAMLYVTPLACISLYLGILTQLSAKEVRSNPGWYIGLFTGVWAAALAVVTVWGSILGVRALEDRIERNKHAPLWGTAGAWLGATLCSTGANTGEGPTVYTTIFPM